MWNIDGCFLKTQFRPVELQCCPVIVCKIPQRPADDLLLLRLKFLRESFLFCSKHPVYHKKYEYLFVPGTRHTLPRQWRTEPAMDASGKINLHIFLGGESQECFTRTLLASGCSAPPPSSCLFAAWRLRRSSRYSSLAWGDLWRKNVD